MGSTRGSVVVIASLALTGGCGLGDGGGDAGSEPEPETVTVTDSTSSTGSTSSTSTQETHTETATATETVGASSTPTSTPDPATSSASSDGDLPTEPLEYADAFVRAWGLGDRDDASRFATSTTVSGLFAMDPRGGSSWSRDGEVDQGGRTQVRYTGDDDMVLYVLVDRATARAGAGDAVVGASLEYEYDPGEESAGISDTTVPETTVATYCDALVRAWGAGEEGTAEKYATRTAMDGLFGDHTSAGGSGWSRSSSDGWSATYTNTDGSTLTLFVNSISVESGLGDGVYYAEFS